MEVGKCKLKQIAEIAQARAVITCWGYLKTEGGQNQGSDIQENKNQFYLLKGLQVHLGQTKPSRATPKKRTVGHGFLHFYKFGPFVY